MIRKIWENPEIQGLNRLPMHSQLLPWTTAEAAVKDAAGGPEERRTDANGWFKTLDGKWNFTLLSNPNEAAQNSRTANWFMCDYNDKDWNTITVPGTWTRQDYDKPHYTNVIMPFENIPPSLPEENPTGLYRTTFSVPANWLGRRVILHIGSAESCAIIYVNGQEAGAAKDTRLPSEFDITPFLTLDGKPNTIGIMVVRYSDASYIEDQDQWWFGGLHRSVYLYTTKTTWIQDIEAAATLSIPAHSKGETIGTIPLRITAGIQETMPQHKTVSISYTLQEIVNGKPASVIATESTALRSDFRQNCNQWRTTVTVKNPHIWSHENPARYVLCVTLSEDCRIIENQACCIGFRSVYIAQRELRINEKPVLIKGVNRHEHNEKTGKTLSTEEMVRDIRLLKQHNFNAVRTCHYPDDERWYELCDKYGIYLFDEANIENHCFYDFFCRSQEWAHAYMERVQRMVLRDKNHPSVIAWSLGNESGHGWTHEMLYAWCHSYDPTRPVNYEGGVRPEWGQGNYTLDSLERGKAVTDFVSAMYPSIDLLTEYVDKCDDYRPFIMCEYSHAMGNSNGSLADYWTAIKTHHGLQGGFIWDWIEQGLEAFDDKGNKYWKYGGDFGDEPNDYDFCLNGVILPDGTPKPAMSECFKVFQSVQLIAVHAEQGLFEVLNEQDFSTLDSFTLRWTLLDNGKPFAEGILTLPPAQPGSKTAITIPVSDPIAKILAATSNTDGTLTKRKEIVLHADFLYAKDSPFRSKGDKAGWEEFILKTGAVQKIPASSQNGNSREAVKKLYTEVFTSALIPNIYRAPLENDGLKNFLHLRGNPDCTFYFENKAVFPWIDMDLENLLCSKTELISGTRYTEVYTLKTGKKAVSPYSAKTLGTCTFNWDMLASSGGRTQVALSALVQLDDSLAELPKIGFTARIPAAYTHVRWYGRGPGESYSDRCAGSPLGLYQKVLKDMEFPYIVPQDSGNRTDVRHIEVLTADSAPVLTVTGLQPFNFSILHHEPADLWKSTHTCDLIDTAANVDGYYLLNIDIAQRGVGTATCGPDTLEKYRIRPGTFAAEFVFSF